MYPPSYHPLFVFNNVQYTLHVAAPVVNCTYSQNPRNAQTFISFRARCDILIYPPSATYTSTRCSLCCVLYVLTESKKCSDIHIISCPMWYPHISAVSYIRIYTLQLMLCTVDTHRVQECTVQDALSAVNMYTIVNNVHTRFAFCLLYPYSVLFIPSLLIQLHAICICMYVCPPSPLSVPLTLCYDDVHSAGRGG
jgi:hypothetical protein